MIFLFIWLCIITILFFIWCFKTTSDVKKLVILNKYNNLLSLLEYFMKQAYDIVYQANIVSYTSSATSIPQPEFETIQRSFIKLTLNLMGPNNKSELVSFFGGELYLIENITLYIRSRILQDELFKHVSQMQKSNPL